MTSPLTPSPLGKRKCAFQQHDVAAAKFPHISKEVVQFTTGRNLTASLKNYISNSSWMPDRSDRPLSICRSCIKYAEEELSSTNILHTSEPTSSNSLLPSLLSDVDGVVRQVITHIQNDEVSEELLIELASALGSKDSASFKRMSGKTSSDNSKSTLLNANYKREWEEMDCKLFKAFVTAVTVTGLTSLENQRRGERHFVSAAHSLCLILNQRFIHPISVSQNIILHSYAGSKTACQIFGTLQPSGSYRYLAETVTHLSQDKPEFPDGDIYIAFDNQQIVGRDYRVSPGASQPSSVVTSCAVYQEEVDLRMQFSEIPTDVKIPDRPLLFKKYTEFERRSKNLHNIHRQDWIKLRLLQIQKEFVLDDGNLENDEVRQLIMNKEYESGLSYDRVEAVSSSCTVYDMENLLINPNSYDTVATVLDNIVKMSEKTSPNRKWITVVCDGAPYTLATNLLKDFKECKTCNITGRNIACDGLEGHEISLKFSKVVLRPGPGHIELNLVRSIFSAFFDIFIRPVAQMLGYTTARALDYCKKALDHHKSWQILQIVYVSLTDEILHLYVKRATSSSQNVSAEGLQEWIATHTWPNLRLAADFVFNILHPLFLFRAGIRQCNDEVAYAALLKASGIFFGFNHPKYRIITVRDFLFQLLLPDVGAGPAKRMGFKMMRSLFGQGLDFLLEERNSSQKHWIFRHGVPTDAQWLKSSSTLTFFEKLKSSVLLDLGITEDSKSTHLGKLGLAYILARSHYREIFSVENLDLTSFCKLRSSLPIKFLNCAYTCKENMIRYVQAYINEEKCALNLVDTTELESLTIDEIKKKVSYKIRQLAGASKDQMSDKFQTCLSKEDFIELVGEVEEEISNIDYSLENLN